MEMQPASATRESWKNEPLPDRRASLSVRRVYSAAEYARIARGFIPQQMEDKWFIFLEGDRLYLHRSWTGLALFEVRFEPHGGDYVLAEAWVNRDPDQYKSTDDDFDAALLLFLIDRLLLGYDPPLPTGRDASDEHRALRFWSLLGSGRARDEPVECTTFSVKRPGPPRAKPTPPPTES